MSVSIEDHGTVVAFDFDDEGKAWADDNLQTEPWQWLGPYRLFVDHRYAEGLFEHLQEEGFDVS